MLVDNRFTSQRVWLLAIWSVPGYDGTSSGMPKPKYEHQCDGRTGYHASTPTPWAIWEF